MKKNRNMFAYSAPLSFMYHHHVSNCAGEPRSMTDPANAPFMNAISRGECPAELDPRDPGVQLVVNLVRSQREYEAPTEPKYKAFVGAGHKLGESAPAVASPLASSAAASGPSNWAGADPVLPRTSIQLRLADGSRMVAEFNLTHTVGDIRRFIRASRPDMSTMYRLATAFPAAQLEDDSVTIEAAGLANSVVIQKM
jgi:UBX domain-containing protein 1